MKVKFVSGLVVACLLGVLLSSIVFAGSEAAPLIQGEESDGDHDRLQDESHDNEDIMNGVGYYDEKAPPQNGLGR